MEPKLRHITFKSLKIQYRPVTLYLHRNFSTAHSTSTTRTNFFIRATSSISQIHDKMYGYGECGLPPKKPGCYMADINDCLMFMQQMAQDISLYDKQSNSNGQNVEQVNLIKKILLPLQSQIKEQIQQLLIMMSKYTAIEHFRAPKCCLEVALLDLLTRYHNTTPTQIFFPSLAINKQNPHKCYSFYTASLEDNKQMYENIKQHLCITKCIKLKYNNNNIDGLLQLLEWLTYIEDIMWLIIDANCSWNPEDFLKFVSALQNSIENNSNYQFSKLFMQKILYIQQPFGFKIADTQKWEQIKKTSPIKILADESFRNQADLSFIKTVAHAVNIKTEKTGGAFPTFMAAQKAKDSQLEVMFGSMCSTQLGCTQTFQFHPMAQFLDVDGALLTKSPDFQGGFKWKQNGRIQPFEGGYGLKVKVQHLFEQLNQQKDQQQNMK